MHMQVSHAKTPSSSSQANTFSTPRASLIRYWNNHISNNLPKPLFLFSKASPLNAQNSAIFTNLATQNSLSSHFHSFCSLANLYCSFEDDHPLTQVSDKSDKKYNNAGKTGVPTGQKKYRDFANIVYRIAYAKRINHGNDTFKKYGKRLVGRGIGGGC